MNELVQSYRHTRYTYSSVVTLRPHSYTNLDFYQHVDAFTIFSRKIDLQRRSVPQTATASASSVSVMKQGERLLSEIEQGQRLRGPVPCEWAS